MIQWDALGEAFSLAISFKVFYWLAIGVIIGVGVGAMPGLATSTGIALMIPFTIKMDTPSALALLIGLYKGGVYGGSISAISFATPGTPEAAATVYDGYKLMQKGQGRKALLMALYASITGDTLSDIITIVLTPPLAMVAVSFGPSERFWLVALAFTLLGALSGVHLAKGMLSASLGLFLGTVGTDPVGAVPRMTFGLWWLHDGIHLVPLMIGIFAISRMLEETAALLKQSRAARASREAIAALFARLGEGLTFREYIRTWKEMLIGLIVGTIIGILPGLGATVAAFLSYSVAKQMSPHKKFGTGILEGVAAPESGNNATVGPTLIPLLAFGIPGSSAAALIGGALMLQGATPSARMMELYPVVVYSLFIILLMGNVFNLAIGRIFALLYARLGQLPKQILVPMVILISVVGTYSFQGNPYDVVVMLALGLVGFVLRLLGIPDAPLVITFLIGPMMEESLRRALLIHQGNWFAALFNSPLSVALFLSTVGLTYLAIRLNVAERLAATREQAAEETPAGASR